MAEKLAELHLAALHELAAELGVPRFRLLRREQLVDEVKARLGAGEPMAAEREQEPEQRPEPKQESDHRPEPDPDPEPEPAPEQEPLEEPATEEVAGALEITPQRYGFLRLRGLESQPDDVYISASQVRRCELRPGDQVSGPARAPRRGERHRALVHVDRVNGGEPLSDRLEFEQLTPILPKRRLALDHDPSDVLTRAVDLLTPLALGQRVLVASAPRSGRTTLLRGIARAVDAAEGPELMVLLIDERPEEATSWREVFPGIEIATATAELAPAEQVRLAELALERARRRAESGADVVLIVDSLSLSNFWDFAERWSLSVRGDYVRRTSAFDIAQTYDIVTATFLPGGTVAVADRGAAGGTAFNSTQKVRIDTDSYGVAGRITHRLFKTTSIYAQVRYSEQDSRSSTLGADSDYESFLATFGVQHVFEPIPLW